MPTSMCKRCGEKAGRGLECLCYKCGKAVEAEKEQIWSSWEAEQLEKGVPQDLIDMRWAYKYPREKAVGGRIIWQKLFNDKPDKFREIWQRREEEYAGTRKPGEDTTRVDDGLERCVQLAKTWLENHKPRVTTVVR